MFFGTWTREGPRNRVLDGGPNTPAKRGERILREIYWDMPSDILKNAVHGNAAYSPPLLWPFVVYVVVYAIFSMQFLYIHMR